MKSIEERFWQRVEKTESCWNWIGSISTNGYGRFHPCLKGKTHLAHRFSWELHFGNIAENLFVCHKCDNRKCVNIDHLFLGTQKQNMQDCVNKLRNAKGEKIKTSNLKNEDVLKIKEKYLFGALRSQLAKEYNVNWSTIDKIISRKTWKHI